MKWIIGIITNMNGILNLVFLSLEQNLKVLVLLGLSVCAVITLNLAQSVCSASFLITPHCHDHNRILILNYIGHLQLTWVGGLKINLVLASMKLKHCYIRFYWRKEEVLCWERATQLKAGSFNSTKQQMKKEKPSVLALLILCFLLLSCSHMSKCVSGGVMKDCFSLQNIIVNTVNEHTR